MVFNPESIQKLTCLIRQSKSGHLSSHGRIQIIESKGPSFMTEHNVGVII